MIETTAPAAATSTTGSAITAATFSSSYNDRDRNDWTPGKMIHLIHALDGAPVAIELDTFTGYTQVNVRLTSVRTTPGYGTFQVLVVRVDGDGVERSCWHPLHKVGTVIVLGTGDVRGRALRTAADERTAAIRKAIPLLVEAHSDVQDLFTGAEWGVSRYPGHVTVSFRPDRKRHPHGSGVRFQHWNFRVTDLG
jgi:hypothetical protein